MKDDKTTYQARDNFVIIRRRKRGLVRGLHMPDISAEAKDFVVESVGHKVENLKVGDAVMIIGKKGEEYLDLPDEPDLLVIDARLIPYIIYRSEIVEVP